ncbi:hypothetical protein ODU13_05870 [Streptococcus suis]
MSKHDKFILTPITSVLNEAVVASYGIGIGIESYSISDYVMQSLFLKMTGFQEQKMKCVSWEMATNDFNYRRRVLSNKDGLGEHSTYTAKNTIFQKFQEVILNIITDSDVSNSFFELIKNQFPSNIVDEIILVLKEIKKGEEVNKIFVNLVEKLISTNTADEFLDIVKELVSESDFSLIITELEKKESREDTANEVFELLKSIKKESKFNKLCLELAKKELKESTADEVIEILKDFISKSEIKELCFGLARKKLRDDTISEVIKIFTNTNLAVWQEKNFDYFVKYGSKKGVPLKQILPTNGNNLYSLFDSVLIEKYEILYRQRNRLAHNVISYQDNLPTLKTLQTENEESRNYFIWFAILVLIDKIFMQMYEVYLEALEKEV